MGNQEPTTQTAVKTYVPASQKELWRRHADELNMSMSEFVRTMVQAGRRNFSDEQSEETSENDVARSADIAGTDRVKSLLTAEGPLDWEELLSALTEQIEADLEQSLENLQADDTVRYSSRDGGYVLVES